MSDIVVFLRARLDEDEVMIDRVGRTTVYYDDVDDWDAWSHFADETRWSREVEAKRRFVDLLLEHGSNMPGCGEFLALLALPWSDHPDYDEEWKP